MGLLTRRPQHQLLQFLRKHQHRRQKPRSNNHRREANKMGRLKLKTLREMNDQDLAEKLAELKTDLAKLNLEKSKGTRKKQTGHIKWLKRDIARLMTLLNERKI